MSIRLSWGALGMGIPLPASFPAHTELAGLLLQPVALLGLGFFLPRSQVSQEAAREVVCGLRGMSPIPRMPQASLVFPASGILSILTQQIHIPD